MVLDEVSLKKLQARLMDLMQKIHIICVENNIRYTMIGGTMIGAVRHQGFIPWDDDIDIGMPYDDYKKFIDVVSSHNYEGLAFGIPGVTEDYFQTFVKVYDTNSTLRECKRIKSKAKGIFVDVFPLSYVGNSWLGGYCNARIFRFWRDILLRKDFHLSSGYFVLVEWIYILLGYFIPASKTIAKINALYERLQKKKSAYMADLDGYKEGIVPAYLFDNFILFSFGSYHFYGVKNADEYLTRVFGDYMTLPPVEKRKPHHIEYLNLNRSYLDIEE